MIDQKTQHLDRIDSVSSADALFSESTQVHRFKVIDALKPHQARAIVEALRKGTVPIEFVSSFTVGRGAWLRYIEEDLEQYIAPREAPKYALSTATMATERRILCRSFAT